MSRSDTWECLYYQAAHDWYRENKRGMPPDRRRVFRLWLRILQRACKESRKPPKKPKKPKKGKKSKGRGIGEHTAGALVEEGII